MNFYGNPHCKIEGRDQRVIDLAQDRLMPPQYEEFCKAMMGGDVSEATFSYWLNVYNQWLENMEDE